MALVKTEELKESAKDQAIKLGGKIRLPRDRYTLRLKKREFSLSKSSGNPMVTNTWEIAAPNDIVVDGQKVVIAGQTFTQYLPTKVTQDSEKGTAKEQTVKTQKRFIEEYAKCGMSLSDWDDEQPPLLDEGILVDAICSTKVEPDFKDDRKTPIKDAQGNDMKRTIYTLEQVLGKSSLSINSPFA